MDFHKSMEEYYDTKLKLFGKCKKGIFNIDDEYGERAVDESPSLPIRVGIVSRGDAYATDITFRGVNGSEFLYHGTNFLTRITTNLPGAFNVYNVMAAICCTVDLGVTPKSARDAISSLSSIEGRMEIINQNPTVIIDYAHTPYALECVMRTLSAHKGAGRLITIFGCGGNRDKEKRAPAGRIVTKYADIGIITEDNSRDESPEAIFSDILRGIGDTKSVCLIPKRYDAIKHALSIARPEDTVAIIGKGHERYIVDKDGYREFDERKAVYDCLKSREEDRHADQT